MALIKHIKVGLDVLGTFSGCTIAAIGRGSSTDSSSITVLSEN